MEHIVQSRCEKEGLSFDKLNCPPSGSINVEPNEEEDTEEQVGEEDNQFNVSFYERGRPIIKELDTSKSLAAIELSGIIATKTEEEAGELIWALISKEI